MKITYITNVGIPSVRLELKKPDVTYILNEVQDIRSDIAIILRAYKAEDKVRAHLTDHYNNPESLRAALRAALCGDLEPGRKILGVVAHSTRPRVPCDWESA